MLSKKIKQVTSVGLSLFNYQDDARSNKHKIKILSARFLILTKIQRHTAINVQMSTCKVPVILAMF